MKYIFMTIAIIILFAYTASADALHPVIGQIQASGVTADDEFIVLENPTAQSVDLGSWSIQYKSAAGKTYYKKNFVKGASISTNGVYIVCGKDYAGACDMKQSTFSLSSSGGTVFLVSNQTLLTSSDSPSIVDQKTYAAASANANTNSNANINTNANINADADADTDMNTDANTNANSPTDDATTTPQVAAAPTVAREPDTILITINEFMPAPTDGKEWIELYDGTGYAVDLAGWTLADGTGRNFVTLDGLIMPAGFKLVELASSHLNNSGDLIILRDANKNEVDSVAYGDWDNDPGNAPVGDAGVAVARIGDGRDTNQDNSDFALTTTPTPGATNIITAPVGDDGASPVARSASDETTTTKISKTDTQWLADLLKTQDDDIAKLLKADNIIIINNLTIETGSTDPINATTVAKTTTKAAASKTTATKTTTATSKTSATKNQQPKTTNSSAGMVIVPPGVVGKDICVVREENRSIEVRLPKDLKISPIAGDIISASGAWSTATTLTLPRLLVTKAAAFTVNDHDTPPAPVSIAMSQLNDHIGELVSTTGTIVEKQPTRLRIAEANASLLIKTNFEANKGDKLSATGLLVKSDADLLLTALAPDALAIIKPPSLSAPSLAQKTLPYGLAVLPVGILSTAVFFGKRLKKKGGGSK